MNLKCLIAKNKVMISSLLLLTSWLCSRVSSFYHVPRLHTLGSTLTTALSFIFLWLLSSDEYLPNLPFLSYYNFL